MSNETHAWRTPVVVPILAYEDVPKAADWLCHVFGFQERVGARLSWNGGGMAWLEVGDGLICLSTTDGKAGRSPKASGTSQLLKVYVDDVDQHFAHATAAGASVSSPLEDGFWGGRVYRAKDLEGHLWEFSQSGRDLPASRWRLPPGLTRGA